jgi:MraZ protein
MVEPGQPQISEGRFRSRSEHNLDAKGRLNIPSRFREILRQEPNEMLLVTNWHKSLKAYPVPVWERIETALLNQGKKQPGMGDFIRYVLSGLTECPLDKQGRILLPPALRADFNIEKAVVLTGMLDHFEIWDKQTWEEEARQTRDNFKKFEDNLSNLEIL